MAFQQVFLVGERVGLGKIDIAFYLNFGFSGERNRRQSGAVRPGRNPAAVDQHNLLVGGEFEGAEYMIARLLVVDLVVEQKLPGQVMPAQADPAVGQLFEGVLGEGCDINGAQLCPFLFQFVLRATEFGTFQLPESQ